MPTTRGTGARENARVALLRLIAVAHSLTPGVALPPLPRGAMQAASLEWVAARLEAFGDRIERAKGLPPAPRRIEPAPWPAHPSASSGPMRALPPRPPRPPPPPAHPPAHPPALGAVAARARQLESLMGASNAPAPPLRRPPPPPHHPPPSRRMQKMSPPRSSLPLPSLPIQIDSDALSVQPMDVDFTGEHPDWAGKDSDDVVEPRTMSPNGVSYSRGREALHFSGAPLSFASTGLQDRREEVPLSPFSNVGIHSEYNAFYSRALSPASEPIPSPMDVDHLSGAARSDAASTTHPLSEPSTLGFKALHLIEDVPSIGLGIRIPSGTSSQGPPLPKLPSALDLPMGSFRSRDNSSATNLDRNSSYQSRGSGGRARLHADYDKIYNRASDEPPPENESQIKIAGGELFVDGRVQDRWSFGKKIGEGGFSIVIRATRKHHPRYTNDQEIPDACAIKVITKRPEAFNRRMVEREVFSYRLLEMVGGHENIVKLYEVSEDDEKVYLVMELLEGGELFSRISERGLYTEKDAANLVVSMLASLCFCHRFNLTHRDVKPENFVFLKEMGNDADLKITDFGIAHYSEDPEAVCRTMCGTPLYIAPEVLFRQPYGAEADLWSLGVIVYIMLVGYPPFHDQDMVQLVKKIKYKPVSFDGPEWVLISEQGKSFLSNLLDKDKSNRMTAQQALEHEWLKNNCQAASRNVLEVAQMNIKSFTTRKRWKAAGATSRALSKLKSVAESAGAAAFSDDHSGATNSDRQSHGMVGDDGNFTVATEDTLAESDLGSLWQRLRRDRALQQRRPRSRTSSRFSASRDRAARLDAVSSPPLTAASLGEPRRRSSEEIRSVRVLQQRARSADLHTLVSSQEPLTSSVSSVDPVSAGRRGHERRTDEKRELNRKASEGMGRQRIGQMWRTRKERTTSHVSEPSTSALSRFMSSDAGRVRSQQSHRRERPRFRLFR